MSSALASEPPPKMRRRLDPKLAQMHSQLPVSLAARISALIGAAQSSGIHPDRVFNFAFWYASVERLTQGDAISREHTRRAKLELAGYIHGFGTGYCDDFEAKVSYRRGRRARQQIKASLESFLGNWRLFEQVVRKHRSALPDHVQLRYSDAVLGDIAKKLQAMGLATVLDEEDLASERGLEQVRSDIAETYVCWRLQLPDYRGKWNDMFELAYTWKMSRATSVKTFRNVVGRVLKAATSTNSFGTSLDSVLSVE
jgi:hypothetical protein